MSGNDWGRRGSATGRGLVAVASSPPRFCQRNFYLILRPFHGSTPLVVKIRLAVFHSVPGGAGGRRVCSGSGENSWPGGGNCGWIVAATAAEGAESNNEPTTMTFFWRAN